MAGAGDAALASAPLYQQVKSRLVARIQGGDWKPGDAIPNEFAIAGELGVSQGTVRKALQEMTAENLLVRRQGRGTFVQRHTPETMLFRFFNFHGPDGQPIVPQTLQVKAREGVVRGDERRRIGLEAGAGVVRIDRVRGFGDRPFVFERIAVPLDLFPGLADCDPIPNTLYDHFQQVYGVTVVDGEERVQAAVADEKEARLLAVPEGTPLLSLDRVIRSFQSRPVEWRVSLCALNGSHYRVKLG